MSCQLNPKRMLLFLAVGCLVGAAVGSLVTYAVMQRSYSIPTSGMVVGVDVGVFADSACTENLTSISWGSMYPGENVTRLVYVKNSGSAAITLSLAAENWSPAGVNGSIAVFWDREGAALGSGQVVVAAVTLSVSPGISGVSDFSVDLAVVGSG